MLDRRLRSALGRFSKQTRVLDVRVHEPWKSGTDV
jgi:hypothetical protein